MEIIVFASYYYPHVGGYEKNIHELAKRLVSRGHHVMVITCDTENADALEFYEGVLINRVSCWNILGKTFPIPKPTLWFLLEMLWPYENYYDVVITQTRFFPLSFIGMLFAKIRKLPLVHVERGTCHVVTTNKFVALVNKVYDHTIGELLIKYASYNVGVSQAACEFIEHLKGKHVVCIYNGIKMPNNTIVTTISNIKRIVYCGRLIYAKGVQDLIEAFNKCCKSIDGLRLIIIGDGNYKKTLVELADKKRNIQFIGEVSQNKVLDILSSCHIFVNPSYSEGLPTSVIEACSVGLPVIATDVGGTNEIIINDESGVLVKPHDVEQLSDSLFKLLMNENKCLYLGNNARRIVEKKFNWDSITHQWEQLLNTLRRSDV